MTPTATRTSTETLAETASATRSGSQRSAGSPRAPRGAAAAGRVLGGAADSVRRAADQVVPRLPAAASASVTAFQDASRRARAASDEALTLGTALSFGFFAGLLVSGANRLIAGASLVPVALLGVTLLDRWMARRSAPPTGL